MLTNSDVIRLYTWGCKPVNHSLATAQQQTEYSTQCLYYLILFIILLYNHSNHIATIARECIYCIYLFLLYTVPSYHPMYILSFQNGDTSLSFACYYFVYTKPLLIVTHNYLTLHNNSTSILQSSLSYNFTFLN